MTDALTFNIVLLFGVFIFTLIMGGEDRAIKAVGATWIVFWLSGLIWIIYVAQHFIVKYW